MFKGACAGEDPESPRFQLAQFGQNIKGEYWILFGYQPAGKEQQQRVWRKCQLQTELYAIGDGSFERSWIQAVVMHDVPAAPSWASCEKRVERMAGDSNHAVGHCKTQSAHRFSKQALLQWARRRHGFIGVVDVDNSATELQAGRAAKVSCAHQIVMTVPYSATLPISLDGSKYRMRRPLAAASVLRSEKVSPNSGQA